MRVEVVSEQCTKNCVSEQCRFALDQLSEFNHIYEIKFFVSERHEEFQWLLVNIQNSVCV